VCARARARARVACDIVTYVKQNYTFALRKETAKKICVK